MSYKINQEDNHSNDYQNYMKPPRLNSELEAENAALKEQVAQLEAERKTSVPALIRLTAVQDKQLTSLQSKSAALVDALEKSRIGLVQWHVPENRYSAINAIDAALTAFKGEG